MGLHDKITGVEVEYMPDFAFRLMSLVFTIRDFLFPVAKRLDRFGIQEGHVVVDFGCGQTENFRQWLLADHVDASQLIHMCSHGAEK